jgi:starvation-inducible outer membrane lipoprotein
MKKILPIALAFSLAACQNNPKPAVDSETTSTVEVGQVLSDAEDYKSTSK